MIVVDTSAAVPFVLPDEAGHQLDEVLQGLQSGECLAPGLFAWEVANVIWKTHRRGLMDDWQLSTAASNASELGIVLDGDAQELAVGKTLELAVRHDLTAYDAAYLELAMRRGARLASFDKALRAAAVAEGVKVIPAP